MLTTSAQQAPEEDYWVLSRAPPAPRAAGEIENCTNWFRPASFHSCSAVLLNSRLSFEQFYRMNPSVKNDCTGLTVGTYYCISTKEDGGPPEEAVPEETAEVTPTPRDEL